MCCVAGDPHEPVVLGGQPLEKVSTDMERDYFMTAEEAMEYGLIDRVLSRRFESDARRTV